MVVRVGQRSARPRRTYFREWREFRGLTQEQLAERLDSTKASVSRLENGRVLYNQSVLEAWADALACEPSDLISRNPNEDDPRSLFAKATPAMQAALAAVLKNGPTG